MLDISLLGTSGMMPLPNRWLTSLALRYNGRMMLIDCGEGTQITLKLQGWGFKAIELICFTHYHADHISGLPGLLLAISNSGRTAPLKLMGPVGLRRVVEGLTVISPELTFELEYIELPFNKGLVYDMDGYVVTAEVAEHMVPCLSYRIDVPRKGKFDVERAKALNLPKEYWKILQNNQNIDYNGKNYTPDMVMGENRKGLRVTYCTDTRPTELIEKLAYKSDLFICEGMYGENEKIDKAIENKHMLFSEAAKLAKNSNSKELWLTHFSPSLIKPEEFLDNAKNIFENTYIGFDRMNKTLTFED